MSGPRCIIRLVMSGFGLILAIGAASVVAAQEATPTAGQATFPIIPDPALCQVEPRSTDELLALWYTPEGSPIPAATPMVGADSVMVPLGPRADAAAVEAVTATVREVFSCFAAGDFIRATALFTDDLTRSFGAEPGTSIEDARAFLDATPPAGAQGEAGQISSISDVMELSDGRLGAIVVDSTAGPDAVYVIFANENGRWLVDEIIDFAPAEGGE